jgi:hypothetical protein
MSVAESCLGRSFPVRIGRQRGSLTLPALAWGQGRWGKDAPSLIAPTADLGPAVDSRIERIAARVEEQNPGVFDYWGMIGGHWPKRRRITGAFVEAALLSFVVPASGLTYSEYLHGLGAPHGPHVSALFNEIDHWFDVLRTWTELFADQDLDSDHPLRNGGRAGAGLRLLTFDGTEVSLDTENNEISVVAREVKPLSLRPLEQAIRRANADEMPSDAWLLVRDAYGSHRRLRYRRAVIEAGTAVELTLADFNNRVTKIKENGPFPPTLGWYASKLKTSAKLPPRLSTDLVHLRNSAIHENRTPTLAQSWTALSLARQVLELHDPLPG